MIIVNTYSNVSRKGYEIKRASEYDIDTSLDIAADHFSIVIENPINSEGVGHNSSVLNPNDSVVIREGDKIILDGTTDDVNEFWGEDSSRIEITGRDLSMLLLENDAEPKTYYKLKLSAFISKLTAPYRFFKIKVNPKFDKVLDKIVVDVGQTEWDCLAREAKKCGLWSWCEPDGTIVADVLNYSGAPSYTFSNVVQDAIRIKKLNKRKRGADIKNEVWVRGHGKNAFTAKFKDAELTAMGYARRMIVEYGEAKTVSHGQGLAKDKVNERKRGSLEIELTVNGKHFVETNRTARVVDKITGIDGVFFIVGVKSTKNSNVGHEKVIRLRPLWEGL